jgi:hypothetical protein
MGLDFSHSSAHFSYSGFNSYRNLLSFMVFGIDYDTIPFDTIVKSRDTIKYILNHSDCDGSITPKRCAKLAVRLRQLWKDMSNKPELFEDDNKPWAEGWGECSHKEKQEHWMEQTRLLVDGFESAAESNEKFWFG